MTPQSFRQCAYNPATESENEIHDDEVARQYGFRGGLVPGVTVFAYLTHPAMVAWGRSWLADGAAEIVLRKPLYDGGAFDVRVRGADEAGYSGDVIADDGTRCATGAVAKNGDLFTPPSRRGDPPGPKLEDRKPATRALLEELAERGLGSIEVVWDGGGEQTKYLAEADAMAPIVRRGRDQPAHPAFTLCLANWVLARNVRLGPWIHTESRVQNYSCVELGEVTVTEGKITALFERNGHDLVDMDVSSFVDDRPVLRAFHRAIYRPRRS